jgi:enterochelin esterase-like enzyme
MRPIFPQLILLPMLLASDVATLQGAPGPLRFKITLDSSVANGKIQSGRMLVLMSDRPEKQSRLAAGFSPTGNWLAAVEVAALKPGASLVFNPDLQAFPAPLSQAPKGKLQFMAVLDPDHSYARNRMDEGDMYSEVVQLELDPSNTEPVELVLSKTQAARPKLEESANIKLVQLESKLLSDFWGRPIFMRAGIVLPPGYETAANAKKLYPAVYNIHGFGGNHTAAWRNGPQIVKEIEEKKRSEMVHVFLDASFPTGHHVFADSVNNGPWGKALTEEFIPHLQNSFRLVNKPYARFVTGHSSGGWTSFWLQVAYPDFFGGTWSTAPDSVDFRSFTGVDATAGSTDNAYRKADGSVKNLVRSKGKNLASLEEFVKQEEVQGPVGGQMASFDWVFSPRGTDGRPMKLFNRETGEQDPFVQKYWERYDIRLLLEKNWASLGPKLLGKLHLFCGSEDTFHLEEAFILSCDFLKSKGREDACLLVPGRDHSDLYRPHDTFYPTGLALRIDKEMSAAFEKATGKKGKKK